MRVPLGNRGPSAATLALAFLVIAPARAELTCVVSRASVAQYESVGITVTDPKKGLDIAPGPMLVTMADSADHRQGVYLDPTGQPGAWSGRFTPVRTGRYTGTALVDRGEEKEIGLVPLIRVHAGSARGFVRLNPKSQRSLLYSNGGTLFPIGVRLHADDVRSGMDWRTLFVRLRANEINFVAVPVAWPGDLPPRDQEAALRTVDRALVEAERTGRLALQLRLEPPPELDEAGATAYEAQLQRWARRWSYSPAVGTFYVGGANDQIGPEMRARFVKAVRAMDPYRHLIAVPGGAGDARYGGDLRVEPWNWQRPVNRLALLEVPDRVEGPQPLPGESSWQMLVLGGVGLPVWPYRTQAADGQAVLDRIRKLARVAGSVPYQAGGAPINGVVPVDTPGSFSRYGTTAIGWVAPDADRVLNLSTLPKGRYRARFWDPGTDQLVGERVVWSTGQAARVELPPNIRSVYLQVQPTVAAPKAPVRRATARKTTKKAPTRKPTAKRKPPVKKKATSRTKVSRKPTKKKATAKTSRKSRETAAKKPLKKKSIKKKPVKKPTKKPTRKKPVRKTTRR